MKDLKRWIEHVEAKRPGMNVLAQGLASYGATVEAEQTKVVGELPYRAQFSFGDATTTIRFLLLDHQTDSDVVVTNMTTLPSDQCSKGYGSRAIQALLQWATDNDLNEVRGTQVSNPDSERFSRRNGFERCPEPNPCNDFVRVLSNPSPQPT